MAINSASVGFRQVAVILRGEPEPINEWIQRWNARRVLIYLTVIVMGAGVYGAAIGSWRDPQQALFTAFKFPLIIVLTMLGNGLLNGMLAPLLGLDANFRQCLQAILMSFVIVGAILGSFSPVIYFLIWSSPPVSTHASGIYDFIQLTDVAVVTFAGMAGNLRLGQLLRRLSGSEKVSRRVLFAWLAGNLLLGSQLAWILRPFIGAPGLPVEFLRKTAFEGNFFESVFHSIRQLLFS